MGAHRQPEGASLVKPQGLAPLQKGGSSSNQVPRTMTSNRFSAYQPTQEKKKLK